MNKKQTDFTCVLILAAGVVILPFVQESFADREAGTWFFCAGTIALMLLMKLFGYSKGYTRKERREDRGNFLVWTVLILVLAIAALMLMGGQQL